MCLPLDDVAMVCWLKQQVRVLEVWREELACRPEIEIAMVTRLERHYAWLTSEIMRLEAPRRAA
ncbi:MAG: hypothetical protein KJ871_14515 [Alphaproteobacteria bacterium]|uniref:hypothetical protein n=1 Tax=Hyphomonas sp. TaxID=87 RepID=UPI001D4E1755|nr:hypothetical protein [Alphaproteobacteria bacterium]MBU2085637.1 hypothetical protein [Alphaproteobacteria bacterium]MBU2141678.1 hypothetical protein [Alphaproteobacteria bacterium]MBU2197641.1 hypothetical protein [Alphaproteobacteria bacterium]